MYAPGDNVFVDRPTSATSAAERLATNGYSKLMLKRHGRYHVLSIRPEYSKILQEGVKNSVSINRAVLVT